MRRRIVSGLLAVLAVCASPLVLGGPVASAAVSAHLDVAAELVDQPVGRPWAVNLLLGAEMTESAGEEFIPVTKQLFFQFPHATLNAGRFPVCRATDGQLLARGHFACPSGAQ